MVYQFGRRLAARPKSGGPSLGRSPARTSSVTPSIKIKSNFRGKQGRHNFWSRACALLFFFAMLQDMITPVYTAAAPVDLIEHSFELAAQRCADLTPLVYRRLFLQHPETEAMFRSEAGDLVKGSMLALTIEAMLDFAGDRSGRFRMIQCEVQSHDAYGTPRKLFVAFFGVIAETLREIIGADWSVDIEQAWQRLLAELDSIVVGCDSTS